MLSFVKRVDIFIIIGYYSLSKKIKIQLREEKNVSQNELLYVACAGILLFIPFLTTLFFGTVLKNIITLFFSFGLVIGATIVSMLWFSVENPAKIFYLIFVSSIMGAILNFGIKKVAHKSL